MNSNYLQKFFRSTLRTRRAHFYCPLGRESTADHQITVHLARYPVSQTHHNQIHWIFVIHMISTRFVHRRRDSKYTRLAHSLDSAGTQSWQIIFREREKWIDVRRVESSFCNWWPVPKHLYFLRIFRIRSFTWRYFEFTFCIRYAKTTCRRVRFEQLKKAECMKHKS